MEGKTLEEYLDDLKECDDPDRLESEFKIQDNWLALLYGNPAEIFAMLTDAYKNPQEKGINGKWEHKEGRSSESTQKFHLDYWSGVMTIQLVKRAYDMFIFLGGNQINGLEHSMYVTMHPYGGRLSDDILMSIKARRPEGIEALKAMKAAVIEFCEYATANKITFRLPFLNIGYVPR
ncbi:MAG: hypothetical protein AABX63_03835 [Nanoarchaeota archaeon]